MRALPLFFPLLICLSMGCGHIKVEPRPEEWEPISASREGKGENAREKTASSQTPEATPSLAPPQAAGEKTLGGASLGTSARSARESATVSPPAEWEDPRPEAEGASEGKETKIPTLAEWTEKVLAETKPSRKSSPAEGSPASTAPRRMPPASPRVKAGFADDNREFGAYLGFLDRFRDRALIWADVANRLVVEAKAGQGEPASFAQLGIYDARGRILAKRTAYADGRALLFPSEFARGARKPIKLEASWGGEKTVMELDPEGRKVIEIAFPGSAADGTGRALLDLCFLLDTTGSMGDEINRLKQTLQVVHAQVGNLPSRPDPKFAMVLFRDRKDSYVTELTRFTGDIDAFASRLDSVEAAGGGDMPEDMQAGLRSALWQLNWRDGAVKVLFILTDAPPHIYEDEEFDYMDAARKAAETGIKIVGIGASGLGLPGEIALRQMAQYSMGQFVFLTYGEEGESEGGTPTSVSHHTGANFQTRNLDAIIVRFVRGELAALRGEKPDNEDWLETTPGEADDREKVLHELFDEGIRQLLDFSLVPVFASTPTAVLPMEAPAELSGAAELLEHRLLLAAARHPAFRLVERADLRQVLAEHQLGLTGAIREEEAVKLGNLVGAQLLILSSVSRGPKLEVLLKLVRAETGEILAVSLLKANPELAE